jgi:alkylhydroperoxidase family enzyme
VAGHTAVALKKAQLDKATVQQLQLGGSTGNTRLDAVARFTAEVIASRGNVGDGALADFVAAGFEPAQALEVVLGVSLATLCNFANNLGRSPINPELQAFRPGALNA